MAPLPSPDDRRTSRGAALVEFALVASLLVMLFGGIADYGTALDASRRAEANVDLAARQGAAAGDDRLADYTIVRAVRAAYAQSTDVVQRVVVYRADGVGTGAPPPMCASAGQPGLCNVYDASQIASLTAADFAAADCVGDPDANWCSTTRRAAFDDGDLLGVAIWVDHDKFFPQTPITATRTAHAVFRFEFVDY